MATFPQISLQPGQTGDAVKQLQQYLVSQGYMTQAEMNTGPGIYGPKTTAAVQKMQQALGVDNSSGPGYFGPRTLAALQKTPAPANPNPPAQNPPANNSNPGTTSSSNATADTSWLESDTSYQTLPTDMQNYLKQYYQILKTNDTQTQQQLKDALTEAQKQADPYWGEIIKQAQDQLVRDLTGKEADFATQEQDLQTAISRIKEDLATKKGDLTIDQQAELARQATKYQNDLDTLRENASGAGLTFSSKRTQAEGQLATSNTDIVESTKLNYMRQARDLETAAARGETDAISKIAEYKRVLGQSEMDLLRNAESKLGSSNLPSLPTLQPGVAPAGDISGTVAEDKTKDIWTRAEALAGLGNPFLK